MGSLIQDIKKSSGWLVATLKDKGLELDYSPDSLIKLDNFMDEETLNGMAKPGGFFAVNPGSKLFAIGSYLGDVVIRNSRAVKWVTDDKDPQGELNIAVCSANGAMAFPVQKVMKRFQNGEEDALAPYVALMLEQFRFEGEIPAGFLDEPPAGKPWWKLW